MPSSRLAKGTRFETGHRHFGIVCCHSEFHRDDQLLSATWLRCGAGSRSGKCVLHNATSMALRSVRCAARPGILAAASRQTMLDSGTHVRERVALDGPCCRVGNDSVSTGNRSIHSRQVFRKMKRKPLIGVVVTAVLLLLGVRYLWGPGSAPRGQVPMLTLSQTNFGEFEKAFDANTDVPRLVLLLSPT